MKTVAEYISELKKLNQDSLIVAYHFTEEDIKAKRDVLQKEANESGSCFNYSFDVDSVKNILYALEKDKISTIDILVEYVESLIYYSALLTRKKNV